MDFFTPAAVPGRRQGTGSWDILVEKTVPLCYSYGSITLKYPFFKKKRGKIWQH
jgi:hypothetical protein